MAFFNYPIGESEYAFSSHLINVLSRKNKAHLIENLNIDVAFKDFNEVEDKDLWIYQNELLIVQYSTILDNFISLKKYYKVSLSQILENYLMIIFRVSNGDYTVFSESIIESIRDTLDKFGAALSFDNEEYIIFLQNILSDNESAISDNEMACIINALNVLAISPSSKRGNMSVLYNNVLTKLSKEEGLNNDDINVIIYALAITMKDKINPFNSHIIVNIYFNILLKLSDFYFKTIHAIPEDLLTIFKSIYALHSKNLIVYSFNMYTFNKFNIVFGNIPTIADIKDNIY